jgi:hypothetical protein
LALIIAFWVVTGAATPLIEKETGEDSGLGTLVKTTDKTDISI